MSGTPSQGFARLLARGGIAAPLAFAALLWAAFVLPHASDYVVRVLTVAGTYALLALGFGFVFGQAGALSLAQGTFMGVGAYVSGIMAVRWGAPFDAALPASIGLPVLLALIAGVPVLRLQTHYFALATLLIGQVVLLIAVQWESLTGGANGIGGIPGLSLFGWPLHSRLAALLLVWAFVAAGGLLAWHLGRGRLGIAYAVLRGQPVAARAIGIDTGTLRLLAFLLSAGYAGLAGSLYVRAIGVLSPDILGFPVMVTCLTIAVVGSRRRVSGAILGAVLIVELPEWARFLRDDYLLAYGCILLLVIVAIPEGLTETADRWLARLLPPPPRPLPAPAPLPLISAPARGETLLEVSGLVRRFGGVRALDGVSLDLRGGEVLGLIGPNGSGKTTLVNVVTGIFRPDAGTVRFAGRDIAGLTPHRIARLGIARTFQTAALAPDLSALENVAIARDAARLGFWRALRARGAEKAAAEAEAMGLLVRMDAAAYALAPAGTLPPGIARRVEIARALAVRPRVLLLDEPAAGLNEEEQADLSRRLRTIAAEGMAIVVIEHNMPFLAPLVDRLICLDRGRVIAAGLPDAVTSDPQVIEAYLGTPRTVQA